MPTFLGTIIWNALLQPFQGKEGPKIKNNIIMTSSELGSNSKVIDYSSSNSNCNQLQFLK